MLYTRAWESFYLLHPLEQLRVLEHGYPIAVRLTPEPFPPGIDTQADLERAQQWLQAQQS